MDSERQRERYRRACELFDAALILPSVERDAFLQDACSADQDLRHEVARMVEHDRRATGLLDHSPIQRIDDGRAPQDPQFAVGQLAVGQLAVGTGLGAYRVVRTLGQGGMGVVYLATRDDDVFERAVAVKVVREATTDEEGPWRFRREREILARLEHPYIARLYDGGITENRQPYLVMEYVEGLPITTYCDHHRLAIGDRLALMRKVCSAVQYAHRNLVVHRDLKPSNILVNADGDPKLLDFGIAKLLDPGNASTSNASTNRELTREQRQVMTLSHASPEQVACRAVTTATDVYGLGVILYELLCGVAPFALDSPSTYELLRLICEQQPQAPSTMIRRLTTVPDTAREDTARENTAREDTARENTGREDTGHGSMDHDAPDEALPAATSVSADRSTSANKLRARLVGDLDAIVSMALRKEPEKRYASVAQLADDLARHLDDRPVVARAKATRYRVSKFLRRHRAAVTVGVVLASLLAGLALAFVLTIFAQVERTVREKDKAEQLLAFLIETFAVANPDAAVGETVTARELLDQGARRVATELEGEPELRAMMLDAMGQIYYQIGLFAPAESLLRESLEHRSGVAPTPSAATAARMTHLGAVLRDAGKLEEAEATLRNAVAMGELLEEGPRLADSLEALAFLRRFQYDYAETEALYRRAVALRRAAGDERKTARTLTVLGILLREEGGFDPAQAVLQEALALRRQQLGASHPEVAESLMELANLEHARGQYGEAEALQRRALRIAIAVHGENHRAVIDIKNALALTLGQSGKDDEASALLAECVEGLRQLAGTEHPDFATMASNLAVMLAKLEKYERAEALFREALDIRLRLFGEGHPYVGQTHLTWGLLEHRRGALASAEAHYRQAADTVARLPAGHRAIAYPKMALAELLIDRGQPNEAESMLDEVLTELRTSHEPTHWRIAMAEAFLGHAQALRGKLESAESHLRSALATLRSVEGNDPTRQRRVLEWLIKVDRQAGHAEQAEEHARLLAAVEEPAAGFTLGPHGANQ